MAMTNQDSAPQDASTGATPHAPALNALPAGYRLLEYSLDGILGHGGFGITYLATDHNLNCQVAIKEYLPADQAVRVEGYTLRPAHPEATDAFEWGLKRFLDEARALATFNHPNIVRVMRFFEANGTAYMVMDLVTGLSLGDWVKRHRPLEERRLLALIRPLLDGLAVIHAAGFVHRDIKPGNIHMRADAIPVLLDFGAARSLVSRTGRELTSIVTPGYAALEQYHTHGNQGPWTDLYSLCALMYGIVTGERPIEAPARVRNDPLKRALELADPMLYSEALLRAIDWGLTPEEERRPQSVAEFARALPEHETHALAATSPAGGGGAAPGTSAQVIDPTLLAQLEAALASHLGPMASVLIRRRAKASPTLESLRTALAEDIDNEPSRRLFIERTERLMRREPASAPVTLGSASRSQTSRPSQPSQPSQCSLPSQHSQPSQSSAPAPASGRFDDAFLTAVESELAQHLGPLARMLVRKSAGKARDRAELFLLLSDNIADEGQRRAFIRKSVAAFKDKT